MNLNRSMRWTLTAIIGILFFVANLFIVITPNYKIIKDLAQSYQQNEKRINDLKSLELQKKELEQKSKFLKYMLTELNTKLPNSLVPEKFIMLLKELVLQSGLEAEDIAFENPKVLELKDIKPTYSQNGLSKRADEIIISYFKKDNLEDKKASDKALLYGNIPDETPIKVNVKFSFEGSYESLKKFIEYLENAQNKIAVNSIEVNAEEDNSNRVKGIMSVTFYGFKDSKIPVYDLWNSEIKEGKSSLFNSAGSERYDIEDTRVCDFEISLKPYTYDAPSVIINKYEDYDSVIFADTNGIENIELDLRKINGKYFYKYGTQSSSYPSSNNYAEFVPSTSKDIIVKVFSKERIDDSDISGINLTIYNKTDKNVKVVTFNDDESRPRVRYSIR